MPNIESTLLLLTVKLSQLDSKGQVIDHYLGGLSELLPKFSFTWQLENSDLHEGFYRVFSNKTTYGFIKTQPPIEYNKKVFPHFNSSLKLLALIIEKAEQSQLLNNQSFHLHQLITEQNEELATTNEELIESNRSLIESNNILNLEIERRKKIEKKLIESDKFFNHATDMLCIEGFDGYYKKINPSWTQVLGWNIEELLSKPWHEFVHPDDLEATKSIKSNIDYGVEVHHFENRYKTKSGDYKCLSWSSFPYPNEGIMFGVARDVTSVKEAEKKLKESEKRFRSIVQSSPNGLYFYHLNSNNQLIFEGANPAADVIIGFKHELLIGKTIQEAFPNLANTHVPESYTKIAKGELDSVDFEIDYFDQQVHGFFHVKAYQSNKGNVVVEFSDISERRRAEEELKKSEQRTRETADLLEGLFNAIPDIIGLQDAFHKILRYNDAGYRFLNVDKDQLKGKHCYELLGLDQPCSNCATSIAIKTKKPAQVEKFITEKGIWFEARSYPIIDENGEITNIVEHLRDITDRKRTEKALTENEEKYRTLIEFAPDAFFHGNKQGNFITMNKRASDLTGYSYEELEDKNMSFLFDETVLTDKPLRYDLLLQGETVVSERYLTRKDGKKVLVEMTSKMLPNGAFQSFMRDISERKKAEDSLITLNQAIEQSPDSIIITDNNGLIEYINPIVEVQSGYSKEELIGKNPRIFSSGQTPKEIYIELWETITSGKTWHGNFQNRRKNSEIYWERASISPIYDNSKRLTHFLAIREDITEQKKMTEELVKAKEKAEESDRLKSSFLANMSHEIRTPMNSIMGFASLLPEEDSKDLMYQYANIIVRNSEQLVHIIDDIVLYSRLQTRLLQNYPKEFDVYELLKDVQQSFCLPEYQKGVELIIDFKFNVPCFIKTDYEKLRQVFTNLVSNAFKYTPKGCITIGATKQNEQFLFFVKDTGIGIPKSEKEKVFERFYRGSNVNKSSIGGTGLGLSIVKELMMLLNGNVWVESEEGKGTKFVFTLEQ